MGIPSVPLIAEKRPVLAPAKKKGNTVTKFVAVNDADENLKPQAVLAAWKVLEKMDPDGSLFANDVGAAFINGKTGARTIASLKFDEISRRIALEYAVQDGDDGIFTVYQLLEYVYAMGRQDELEEAGKAMLKSVRTDEDDDGLGVLDTEDGEGDDEDDDETSITDPDDFDEDAEDYDED